MTINHINLTHFINFEARVAYFLLSATLHGCSTTKFIKFIVNIFSFVLLADHTWTEIRSTGDFPNNLQDHTMVGWKVPDLRDSTSYKSYIIQRHPLPKKLTLDLKSRC